MQTTEELHVTTREEWRAWLEENHSCKKEIWLIYYKKHTGKHTIPYDDAVKEALCFGWIDSIVRRIDEARYARKFTPRKDKSVWSELNKKRAEMMIRCGRMTEAGLTKIKAAKKNGEWDKTPTVEISDMPLELKRALAANKKAREYFNNLAPSYKKHYVGWIASAKREETRAKRVKEAITSLEQNQKLGMK